MEIKTNCCRDFLGNSVVKTPCSQCRGTELIPDQGTKMHTAWCSQNKTKQTQSFLFGSIFNLSGFPPCLFPSIQEFMSEKVVPEIPLGRRWRQKTSLRKQTQSTGPAPSLKEVIAFKLEVQPWENLSLHQWLGPITREYSTHSWIQSHSINLY